MSKSVERVRQALAAAGHPDTIENFPDGTRSAVEAAAAVGCSVAQIVKSMVFRAGETPVLVLASGANQVDVERASALAGAPLERPDGRWVRAITGFAIGGVAPVGHLTAPTVLVDEDLLALDPIWAAAGSPLTAFKTGAAELLRMTGGRVCAVKQEDEGSC